MRGGREADRRRDSNSDSIYGMNERTLCKAVRLTGGVTAGVLDRRSGMASDVAGVVLGAAVEAVVSVRG